MLKRAVIAAAFLNIALVATAEAQDWFTVTNETTDVTYSTPEPFEGGARVWVRFARALDGGEDAHMLLSIACAQPGGVTLLELRRVGAQGRVVGSRSVPGEPMTDPWVNPLGYAVCNFQPPAALSVGLDTSATQQHVEQMLRSEDAAQRQAAIELVLSEPGGFPPLAFARFASVLIEAGREREALEWLAFGHMRMAVDMTAAERVNEDFARISSIVAPMYGARAAFELGDAADRLSEEERMTILLAALERDAQIPRHYPVDWFAWQDFAANVAWGSREPPRPGHDFALRRELEQARADVLAAREQ